jgi:hypothetical protein
MENKQMQLWTFWAIGKPTKKPLTEALRPAAPDEHQPGCFALEEERGANWKGSGGSVPSVKETKPSL